MRVARLGLAGWRGKDGLGGQFQVRHKRRFDGLLSGKAATKLEPGLRQRMKLNAAADGIHDPMLPYAVASVKDLLIAPVTVLRAG